MNKRALLLLGAKGTGALALFGIGIGAYVLFSPNSHKIVKPPQKSDKEKEEKKRIVKTSFPSDVNIKLTHVKEFVESKFFITCSIASINSDVIDEEKLKEHYSSPSDATPHCKRYIESKALGGQPIWLKQEESKLNTSYYQNWKTYKFTYKKEVEENIRDYYGLCFPLVAGKPEPDENPCSTHNLPEGWTKSLVSIT